MRYYETIYIVDPNLENTILEKTMIEIGQELEKTKAKINITVLKIDNLGNSVFNIISFLVIFKKSVRSINATTLRANITCRIEISTASNLMTVSCNANAVIPSMIYVIARKLFSFI